MRSLRQVLGRDGSASDASIAQGAVTAARWNTLSTLGAGAIADVDAGGVIFPRHRPLSVEVWFGSGERWLRGSADAGVRQTRIVGLPIIETRQRVNDADVVQTAWADEAGDGRGRVIIDLRNEGDVAVVAAIVVRPQTLAGRGHIAELRVADQRIVADRLPLIDLARSPGDVAVAIDADGDGSVLLDTMVRGAGGLIGHEAIRDDGGLASLAAMIPLTPGVDRQIEVLDGREVATVAPAPLDRIVAGWKSHLADAAEIELPSWPKHIPPALMSSLLAVTADRGAPLGDDSWRTVDDASIAVALGGVGLHWAASSMLERLFDDISEGRIDRPDWPAVGAACAAVVGSDTGDDVLRRHADLVVAIAGETLSVSPTPGLDRRLVEVVRVSHGAVAAADAASIVGAGTSPGTIVDLARLGVLVSSGDAHVIDETLELADRPLSVENLGLAMVATAQTGRAGDVLVPVRALAGNTWTWNRSGCGDSPHARAALLIGLRSLCVGDDGLTVDLLPGMSASWLGQNLRVSNLPTSAGRCSFAIRWHGERPALLWEFDPPQGGLATFALTCASIDPTFRSTEPTGETLLNAPTHLVKR